MTKDRKFWHTAWIGLRNDAIRKHRAEWDGFHRAYLRRTALHYGRLARMVAL